MFQSLRKYRRAQLISLFVYLPLSLTACGGFDNQTSETEEPESYAEGNTVYGPQLGTLEVNNISELRKPIQISVNVPHADLSLDQAYAAQTTSSSDDFIWMIPVTNISSTLSYCNITIHNGDVRDSQNQSTGQSIEATELSGQLKKLTANNNHINSCLGPGESGHFLGLLVSVYSQANGIVFSNISVTGSGITDADVSLVPESYYISDTLNLQLRNDGLNDAEIGPASIYVILHSDDTPLKFGYLNPAVGADPVVNPDQTHVIVGPLYFAGSAEKMVVYLNYDNVVN